MSETGSNQPHGQQAHEEDQDELSSPPPLRKKIRFADPDFQVTCKLSVEHGEEDDDEDDDDDAPMIKEKTFQCHSLVMALLSKHFDVLLSTGMKESIEKKVTLQGVDPDTFERALSLLEYPAKAVEATPYDLMEVAPFYNEFEFTSGLDLVEKGLGKYLEEWTDKLDTKNQSRAEVDLSIRIILFAEEANITSLIEKSIEFLIKKLEYSCELGHGALTVEHVKKLQNFLIYHPACVEEVPALHDQIGFKDLPDEHQQEFPQMLVSRFEQLLSLEQVRSMGTRLKVSLFIKHDDDSPARNVRFTLKEKGGPGCRLFFALSRGESEEGTFEISVRKFDKSYHALGLDDEKLFEDLDWYLSLTWKSGGRMRCHYFAFPFSNHCLLPPTQVDGWVKLPSSDDTGPDISIHRLEHVTPSLPKKKISGNAKPSSSS